MKSIMMLHMMLYMVLHGVTWCYMVVLHMMLYMVLHGGVTYSVTEYSIDEIQSMV